MWTLRAGDEYQLGSTKCQANLGRHTMLAFFTKSARIRKPRKPRVSHLQMNEAVDQRM